MPDPILAYRFVPNAEYYYHKENPKAITGTFNNFGWRDRDWTVEKPSDVIRIAIIGDSFVEAFQVELDSTFIRIAERQLNSKLSGEKIQLMNFGRSGFTQTEQLWLLQNDVGTFSPDIVVVTFLPFNDIEDVRRETAPDNERPFYLASANGEMRLDVSFNQAAQFKTKSRVDIIKRSSAFVSLLAERYSMFKLQRDIEQQKQMVKSRTDKLTSYLSLASIHSDAEYLNSYRHCKFLFRKMAEYCKQSNKELLIVCLDNGAYTPQREAELAAIDSTFNSNFFEDDLAELSSSLQIHYLGMQRISRDAYMKLQRPLHWGHLNYEGHQVVAEALAAKLSSIIKQKLHQ
jgi:hypothetical protein